MSYWSCHARPARVQLVRGLQGSFLGSASGLCAAHEEGAGEKDGSRCRRGDTVMHEAEGDTWCAHRAPLLGARPVHAPWRPLQASAALHKHLLCADMRLESATCAHVPAQAGSSTSGGLPRAPRKLLRDPRPPGVRRRSRGRLKLVSDDPCAGPTTLLWTVVDHVPGSCFLLM